MSHSYYIYKDHWTSNSYLQIFKSSYLYYSSSLSVYNHCQDNYLHCYQPHLAATQDFWIDKDWLLHFQAQKLLCDASIAVKINNTNRPKYHSHETTNKLELIYKFSNKENSY